jgi:hypothetical protein
MCFGVGGFFTRMGLCEKSVRGVSGVEQILHGNITCFLVLGHNKKADDVIGHLGLQQ